MSELKILAIGDFHGKFPNKLFNLAKSDKIDLIVTQGDFDGDEELSRLFFKYSYETGEPLYEFIGKSRADKLEKRSFSSGLKILKKLDSIGKPVVAITGNWDYSKWNEVGYRAKRAGSDKKYVKKFYSFINKLNNVHVVDYFNADFQGINFVGYPRSSYPGFFNKNQVLKLKRAGTDKELKLFIKRTAQDNKEYYRKIKLLFTKHTILVSHNVPYKTKLDIIKRRPEKGKHYGSYLARKIILDLKPLLAICGHMHENQGIIKLGSTPVVNAGAANEGKGALITINLEKKKVKSIKLIR